MLIKKGSCNPCIRDYSVHIKSSNPHDWVSRCKICGRLICDNFEDAIANRDLVVPSDVEVQAAEDTRNRQGENK